MALTLLAVIVGAVGVGGLFAYHSQDLPGIFKREDFRPRQITRIMSRDGEVIDELVADDGRRTVVAFDDIALSMRDAILAAEDADFYRHQGLDYMGMVRALYYAVRYERVQGASTITQQVVKNLILTPERTLKRKVQEILLARRLDERLAKDDILYIYLNQIYFGHGNYGIEEAARFYFGVRARDLSLAQAATLAGLVQSPERLSPIKHPKRSLQRRRYVLTQMWKKGFIDEASARAAMEVPLKTVTARERGPHLGAAPYYAAHVRRLLQSRYPDEDVAALGLRVTTAVDLKQQALAQDALRAGLRDLDARKGFHHPLRRLKPKGVVPFLKEQRRGVARGVKRGQALRGVVTKVLKGALEVGVGDLRGRLEVAPGGRANPAREALGKVFGRGDVVKVVAVKAARPGAQDVVWRFDGGPQAALVSIDVKTRHVEALVGGYDFKRSSFNRATQARRQTGSAFKPVVYGAALAERASTPASVWLDAPKPFALPDGEVWSPRNADGRFRGPMTMRKALALSRNVVAVRLLETVTIPKAQAFGRALGLTSPLVDNYTMALGSSELTLLEVSAAFATIPDQGRQDAPRVILAIHDSYGQPLYESRRDPQQAIPASVAWLLADMMTSVLSEGTASKVGRAFKRPAAGKTGTTNKSRDAWFMGFTPQKVTGVWVGMDDNTPMGRGVSGGSTAAPIWLSYMQGVHKDLPRAAFERPPIGLVEAVIDPRNGLLAAEGHKPRRTEYFLTGTAPTQFAPEDGENTAGDFLIGE